MSNKKIIVSSDVIRKNYKELTEFDLLPLTLNKLLETGQGILLAVLSTEGKQIALSLNSIESTMLIFVYLGCNKDKHINSIYDLYLQTLESLKTKIESLIIEAKQGDIYYGKICLKDNKNRELLCQCTAGDAIVLSSITSKPLFIVRNVLDDSEPFDMNELNDYDEEMEDYEE